jgi:hypothetical protein
MNRRISRLLEEAERQKRSGESTVTSESRSFLNSADADGFFEELRPELFRVSEWNGKTTLTSFESFDERETWLTGKLLWSVISSASR